MNTSSYWTKSASLPRFRKLDRNLKVDVVVIGAGITGTTVAYLLKKAGHAVALLERGRCGGFDTTNTTAHLTCVTDTRLHELVEQLGKDSAKAVWDAGRAAIDQIFNNIRNEEIQCYFKWVPGFLHTPGPASDQDKTSLIADARLAREFGFRAEVLDAVPLVNAFGVKFSHQAKFHPLKYLGALLRAIPGKGSHVFENSEVEEVQEKPLAVKVGGHRISCSYVVIATHTPLTGKSGLAWSTLFQTKLYLYTSYAVGGKIPLDDAEEASFWDTGDPYNYLRVDRYRNFAYAILGGEDHKTGQVAKPGLAYERLEKRLKKIVPSAAVDSRWSGQVIETPDGLPYIGETAEKQFAATGFSGNGMTFGTLGAMMALDAIEGRANPWRQLFDVNRKKISGVMDYLRENKDYPYYLLRDWLSPGEGKSLKALRRNEGKILQLHGKKVAAYRNAHGKVSLCSPVCTHLGCIVGWNNAEKTWDCPCHGSRFAATGEVLSGPAEAPLEKIEPGQE